MNKQKTCSIVWLLMVLTGLMLPLWGAAEESLSETWVMKPKAGQAMDFEQAFKQHIAHRAELKDPRSWRVYVPVLGDELNHYIVRSCCFGWGGLDEYRQWNDEKNPMVDWEQNVGKLVDNYEHYLSLVDMQNSNWPDDVKYQYVGVTDYKVKQGHVQAMEADKKMLSEAAKAQKWPYSWSWGTSVGGAKMVSLAVPYQNYAEMAAPETGFAKMLATHLGSEDKAKEVLERWSSHFESTHYALYQWREDLSM